MIIAQNPYPARVCYKDEVPVKTKKHRVRKHDALFGALTRFEPVTITHVSVPLPWARKLSWGCAPNPRRICAERTRSPIKTKKHRVRKHDALFGAANQIRTGDLVLTKDVLYHLSHSSKSGRTIARPCGDPERARTVDLQRDRLAF